MKYSLRSLMIGITLFCVVLGGRIEYLRRWAVFHEQREAWHFCEMERRYGVNSISDGVHLGTREPSGEFRTSVLPDQALLLPEEDKQHLREALIHFKLASEYRQAVYRPWVFVDEAKVAP
jgi:hypothetical protein